MSSDAVTMTYDQLKQLLAQVLEGAQKLNPLEQKKLDDTLESDRRKKRAMIELGYVEEVKRWNQQRSCTHCRYPAGAGNHAGQPAPTGQGEWCTAGQVHSTGNITIICQRCPTTWQFKASQAELEYAANAEHGLLGFVPPPIERCLNKDAFLQKAPTPPVFEGEAVAV